MEQTQEPAGQISGQVLFYTQPEPLSKETHGNLGVVRMDKPYGFAAQGHVVPLTVAEFGMASLSYPIIFAGEQRQPLAVMGVNAGQNLFVKEDGGFEIGAYVPAYIRRYPFVLANDQAQQRMIVCIERGSALFKEEGHDMPLFDDKGEPSEYTKGAIKFCEDFETERRRTEQFVTLLTDLDLFETKRATFTPLLAGGQRGEPQLLAEYYGVSEEKLRGLTGKKLAELRDSGALEKIYNHLSSLIGWDRIVALAAARGQPGPAAANLQ